MDTRCFLYFIGTLHRRKGFYTVQTVYSTPEVPNHRVATRYRYVEEFLSGRDPLPVRGRIPIGSRPATGPWKNSYWVTTRYRSVEEFLSGRDQIPVRGRIPIGLRPATGPWKNSYRVTTRYRSVEEFIPGCESVLGETCVCYLLCMIVLIILYFRCMRLIWSNIWTISC